MSNQAPSEPSKSAESSAVAALEAELAKKNEAIVLANQEIKLLREKVAALMRRMFGSSSEKLDEKQLELLQHQEAWAMEGKAAGPEVAELRRPEEASRPRRERRPRLPEHLPVIEEQIIPEAVKACPEAWRKIGEEVTETLDYEPARFFKRRVVRPKFVKRSTLDAVPIVAALPPSLQERCIAAPGLLAQIVVAKFCDHLPLYRQEKIYQTRHGVELSRQTMATWMGLVSDWLKPIYERIRTGVMDGGYVQIDETPIKYLDPGNGKTKQGYFWAQSKPGQDVCFHWFPSRAAECLEKIIPVDFAGVVQCDGYAAYPAFAKGRGDNIALAGCWAHVRRCFYEALELAPQHAGWIVRQIQQLYKIEAKLRRIKAGPRLRLAVRAHQSVPIQTRIHKALSLYKKSRRFLPQSTMGKAIDYALGQWPALQVWLRDGRIEIDNNIVENAIRPTALGKKNWLFIGDVTVGDRGAILYTLIESCRRRGVSGKPSATMRGCHKSRSFQKYENYDFEFGRIAAASIGGESAGRVVEGGHAGTSAGECAKAGSVIGGV